jgi:membrane protease YdiL (CAAX protease family)
LPIPGLQEALLKVVPFAIALPVALLVAHMRGFSFRDDVRLVWPDWGQAAVWVTIWLAWVALAEWGSRQLGYPPPEVREGVPLVVIAILVVGMVVLAPTLEEILFRGLLFRFFERMRLGSNGAVIVTAALFTALHFQYHGLDLLQVFLDGVLFGLARKTARSVPLCILMHALGNAYAAYLRFHG